MSRTNIDIDDALLRQAMDMFGFRSKREAVDTALAELIGGRPMTVEEIRAMEGTGWYGDEASFGGRFDDDLVL